MAAYVIKAETDRLPAAIDFAKQKLDELNAEIRGCDYIEDVNGNPVYAPGSYAAEKRELIAERNRWQTMYNILTVKTPASVLDW